MSWGNISTGGGFSMDYEKTNVESTRYYLQLPVVNKWGLNFCDDVRLKLAVGPYVAVGIGGRTNAYVSSSKYNIDEETGVGQYEYRNDYYRFGTFKGKTVNENLVLKRPLVWIGEERLLSGLLLNGFHLLSGMIWLGENIIRNRMI